MQTFNIRSSSQQENTAEIERITPSSETVHSIQPNESMQVAQVSQTETEAINANSQMESGGRDLSPLLDSSVLSEDSMAQSNPKTEGYSSQREDLLKSSSSELRNRQRRVGDQGKTTLENSLKEEEQKRKQFEEDLLNLVGEFKQKAKNINSGKFFIVGDSLILF